MDEKIKAFLKDLSSKLDGLPDAEKSEALNYYGEYINDALDEGVFAEELLERFESPEKIASAIKAEISIKKARKNPNLKSYSRVARYVRIGITKPFTIFLFSIFIFVTYAIAVMLFLSAAAAAAAACISLIYLLYEAFSIPGQYIAEITGTISFGVFTASFLMIIAFALYGLCRFFIKLSSSLAGLIFNKTRKPLPVIGGENTVEYDGNTGSAGNTGNTGSAALLICVILMSASLVAAFASGLPLKLFMIFNSMEPVNFTMQEWKYASTEIDGIRISTAHSHIRLGKSRSDKIEISYKQADWLSHEITSSGGQLTFMEKSNGRLPLFYLVSMHENNAEFKVSLPEGYSPDNVRLESRGGFIHIDSVDFDTLANTYTGSVYVAMDSGGKPAVIKAGTESGLIWYKGEHAGEKNAEGTTQFVIEADNGAGIEIETKRGNIFIE